MKSKLIFGISLVFLIFVLSYYYIDFSKNRSISLSSTSQQQKAKPLLAYTFENLRKTVFPKSKIVLDRSYSETATSTSQIFYFKTPKKPGSTEMDTVSGLMNMPKKPGTYPIIVMLRGFVPDNLFAPGVGTQHVAETLAQNGYITLAPDFLGFGESSLTSSDSFEARFQTYTTVLSLLSSLSTLNEGLEASYSGSITVDANKVGIWGHSNGGHIALSVLAISGKKYPTVLWAPVSKSFPYSILYYSDDADDHGKALRAVLANFEKDYDTDVFSPLNYYSWIQAPISIHQGTYDEAVPEKWSQDLELQLKNEKVDVAYHTYPGDHNMVPSWNEVVKDTISFYNVCINE